VISEAMPMPDRFPLFMRSDVRCAHRGWLLNRRTGDIVRVGIQVKFMLVGSIVQGLWLGEAFVKRVLGLRLIQIKGSME
jgi:hypothetical protein